MKKLTIITSLVFVVLSREAKAFLPPEFFVQGLTSVWAILAGGIAVALAPFLIAIKQIKVYFSKYKKLIIFLIIQNIVLGLVAGAVFYYKFYKPLYYESSLFSQGNSGVYQEELDMDLLELASLNENYIVKDGVLRDRENDKEIVDANFSISIEDLEQEIKNKENVYFIDIREIEEFNAGHIEGSKHYRGMDLELDVIYELFSLNEESFNKSQIVLVCHDGGRGRIQAKRIGLTNIKYIVGGIEVFSDWQSDYISLTGPVFPDYEIFGDKYQKDFQMNSSDAIDLIKNDPDVLLIDGRHKVYFDKEHIDGSMQLNIGRMTSEEYENALAKVLEKKGGEIILVCNRYGELFHANLLFLRLERDYGFDDSNFHIVFNQFDDFRNNPDIKIVLN
ncbi:hypothetical protein C0584_02515 [Candidatus Parcubacteria bacterium]|nr:MAG: hypothetical protein C0584_02515 [Candidatus Parcubacteria bacterium]